MYFIVFVLLIVPYLAAATVKNELVLLGDDKFEQVIKSPRPAFKAGELPTNFDYRTKGLLTMDLNQHIPVYW